MSATQPSRLLQGILLMLLTTLPAVAAPNPFKAPLYWSVYENQIIKENAGLSDVHISEEEWRANIDWVDRHLKPFGYTMVCIDGWGDVSQLSPHGYRLSHSRHWEHDYAWWSDHLRRRGLTLGMYGNPLWVHVANDDTNHLIVGTDIPVASLKDPSEDARFPWVQVDRPGAEAYVKGWIHFYADMGIDYYRIDFLSWFEDGWDRYNGRVGPARPREHYLTALRWMREAADERGMFLSLVMPHLHHDAEAERTYGHMIRINEDTGHGAWLKWNDWFRGEKRTGWSVYANPVDGLTYWSFLSGRNRLILDPDFIRLNTFDSVEEKRSVISLCLLAGAPVTVADQHDTIGQDTWLYANRELLALHRDGFVGHPLTNDPTRAESQIWTGQLANGDWIIGLFNRENTPEVRSIDLRTLGRDDTVVLRDLWAHRYLTATGTLRTVIPPRGCRVLRLLPADATQPLPETPTALRVASIERGELITDDGRSRGTVRVRITDPAHQPVAGAEVFVRVDGSFDETLTGWTNPDGAAALTTTATTEGGDLRLRACVTHVIHPELSYAADLNLATCDGIRMHLAGTFNQWTPRPMPFREGVWRLEAVPMRRGEHRLKFADTPDFTGTDWGGAEGLAGTLVDTTGGAPDTRFTIERTGYYDVTLHDASMTYRITRSPSQTRHEHLYVAGTFSDWKPLPLRFDGAVWRLDRIDLPPGEHQLKFLDTPDFTGTDWGHANGPAGEAAPTTGGGANIVFHTDSPAPHRITFHDLSLEYTIQSVP